MALGEMVFHSQELRRNAHIRFILPEGPNPFTKEYQPYDRPAKVLILLHGHGNGNEEWITSSCIREMASRYNIAVFMPNGENSFYLNREDAKANYMNFVGDELVQFVRKTFSLSDRREDTLIGGISMGGFGALHTGLAFPNTFGKIMALSSALILYDVAKIQPGHQDGFGGYDYYTAVFGPIEHVLDSDVNPEYLAQKIQNQNAPMPGIFMACGTEDFLLENNRRFKGFLDDHHIEHIYRESAGDHNFRFWNPMLEEAAKWMA